VIVDLEEEGGAEEGETPEAAFSEEDVGNLMGRSRLDLRRMHRTGSRTPHEMGMCRTSKARMSCYLHHSHIIWVCRIILLLWRVLRLAHMPTGPRHPVRMPTQV
jgi:hypothetical protein